MSSHTQRRSPARRQVSAVMDRRIDHLEYECESLYAERDALIKRAIDAEQRNALLTEQVRIQREIIESLKHRLAASVRADEITTAILRDAA